MVITRLFAIFPQAILWGLKTPAICFFFCRFHEEDEYVQAWGWSIQKEAHIFFFYSIFIGLLIYCLFSILLSTAGNWPSGACAVQGPLGPGFDSQVPQKLYVIFHVVFLCRFITTFHHGLPHSQCAKCLQQPSKGQGRRNTMFFSQSTCRQSRKSIGLAYWA